MMPLLQINDLIVLYGEIERCAAFRSAVDEGQVVTLLGANGAGKSTTLRAISGLAKPAAGEILFDGKSIAGLGPRRSSVSAFPTCRRGGGCSPASPSRKTSCSARRTGGSGKPNCCARPTPCSICFPISGRSPMHWAGPVGRSIADGRRRPRPDGEAAAAAADEPSLGLAPVIVQAVFRIITEIRRNTTVLLVEQNARMGLSVADHGYVLETGRIVLGGEPSELWGNEAIAAAYLGGHAKVTA